MQTHRLLWLAAGVLAGFAVASAVAVMTGVAPDPTTFTFAAFHAALLSVMLVAIAWPHGRSLERGVQCGVCGSPLDAAIPFCPACGEHMDADAEPRGTPA